MENVVAVEGQLARLWTNGILSGPDYVDDGFVMEVDHSRAPVGIHPEARTSAVRSAGATGYL